MVKNMEIVKSKSPQQKVDFLHLSEFSHVLVYVPLNCSKKKILNCVGPGISVTHSFTIDTIYAKSNMYVFQKERPKHHKL